MHTIVICCAFAALAVAGVSSYNFDDAVYNQILAEDLQDMEESLSLTPLHARNRRDEEAVIMDKCKSRRKRVCCAETVVDQMHETDRELKRTCFREVLGKEKPEKTEKPDREERGEFDPFRCDKVDKHRREMTCVMQCVGQKKEIVDADGNIVEEKLKSLIKNLFEKESWFASLQDTVITTCLAEAKNATEHRETTDTEQPSCNPAAAKLGHCLFREIQLNCPAEEIKDQKACTRLQERLKRHDSQPPQPFMNDDNEK